MDPLDEALCRAQKLFLEDSSDVVEDELSKLMPGLVEAGYAEESDYGDGLMAWGFTKAGIERGEALGCI